MTFPASVTSLFNIELPIIQAPMAGAQDHVLAAAVSNAGGLGSVACASIDAPQALERMMAFRALSNRPVNMNFFCHPNPVVDEAREKAWRQQFAHYYQEFDIAADFDAVPTVAPVDSAMCEVIEEIKPEVVSFHFGLPDAAILSRVGATGAKIMSSATTRAEAVYLEAAGCDAVIAQGSEAGGHRGLFLDDNLSTQCGTMSLVPQIVDTVSIPVIAAGGIADGRGIAAALILGASAVQMGTRFLKTPESRISDAHRAMLLSDDQPPSALTNIFSGRPARSFVNRAVNEFGPISDHVSEFPQASMAMSPLKTATPGSPDFTSLWAGQSAHVGDEMAAADLVQHLVADTGRLLGNP